MVHLPGLLGEHMLQGIYGTAERARRFYRDQVCERLLPGMAEFGSRMDMVFVATADGHGEYDASLWAGPAGFIQVLDDRHLAYPDYWDNGVLASLGNISENPHVGLLMVDFIRDLIGLHISGHARIVEDAELRVAHHRCAGSSSKGVGGGGGRGGIHPHRHRLPAMAVRPEPGAPAEAILTTHPPTLDEVVVER